MIIYSQAPAPKRREFDLYPTPPDHARAALKLVSLARPRSILDPGAGAGVWGEHARHLWPAAWIEGVEIRDAPHPPAYSAWHTADFMAWDAPRRYDMVIGNPPYALAEPMVRKCLDLLEPGGFLVFLLRLAFLEGQARAVGLWRECPPKWVAVCDKRPSFTGDGNTNATAFMFVIWRKGWQGTSEVRWIDGGLDPVPLL